MSHTKAVAVYREGLALEAAGKLHEAVDCYRRALKLDPDLDERQIEADGKQEEIETEVSCRSAESSKCQFLGFDLLQLPEDLIVNLLALLDVTSLERVKAANRTLRAMCGDPRVWQPRHHSVWAVEDDGLCSSGDYTRRRVTYFRSETGASVSYGCTLPLQRCAMWETSTSRSRTKELLCRLVSWRMGASVLLHPSQSTVELPVAVAALKAEGDAVISRIEMQRSCPKRRLPFAAVFPDTECVELYRSFVTSRTRLVAEDDAPRNVKQSAVVRCVQDTEKGTYDFDPETRIVELRYHDWYGYSRQTNAVVMSLSHVGNKNSKRYNSKLTWREFAMTSNNEPTLLNLESDHFRPFMFNRIRQYQHLF